MVFGLWSQRGSLRYWTAAAGETNSLLSTARAGWAQKKGGVSNVQENSTGVCGQWRDEGTERRRERVRERPRTGSLPPAETRLGGHRGGEGEEANFHSLRRRKHAIFFVNVRGTEVCWFRGTDSTLALERGCDVDLEARAARSHEMLPGRGAGARRKDA